MLSTILILALYGSNGVVATCDWPSIGNRINSEFDLVGDLYIECAIPLSARLPDYTEDQRKAVFAAIGAYSMKPYGSSTALALDELTHADYLDCDNYVAMAHYIYRGIGGNSPFRIVGFVGGVVGNHAQAIVESEAGSVLLDPTVGIVARIGFNDLLRGKPVVVEDFRWREEISQYHSRVVLALQTGAYKPSDLMYWFASIEDYRDNTASSRWATPGAYWLEVNQQ